MTKTISLTDDAYKILRSMKLKGESFSQTIKRLSKRRGTLSEILDLYPELAEAAEYEEAVEETRKKIDKGLAEVP
jgi:predicted CopG family antitoxin